MLTSVPIKQVRKLFSACTFVYAWFRFGVEFVHFHFHPGLKSSTRFFGLISSPCSGQ